MSPLSSPRTFPSLQKQILYFSVISPNFPSLHPLAMAYWLSFSMDSPVFNISCISYNMLPFSIGDSGGKEFSCNAEDSDSVTGMERSPGAGNGYPLQYSYLENSTDRGAWQATDHGVTKSQTRTSD